MPSSGRLQRYGICTLLLGVLLALYGCEGDPQAKKARYMQKGLAYMAERQYTAAVLEFKNAVQLDANDAQAHYQLGLVHLQLTAEHRDRGHAPGADLDRLDEIECIGRQVLRFRLD